MKYHWPQSNHICFFLKKICWALRRYRINARVPVLGATTVWGYYLHCFYPFLENGDSPLVRYYIIVNNCNVYFLRIQTPFIGLAYFCPNTAFVGMKGVPLIQFDIVSVSVYRAGYMCIVLNKAAVLNNCTGQQEKNNHEHFLQSFSYNNLQLSKFD